MCKYLGFWHRHDGVVMTIAVSAQVVEDCERYANWLLLLFNQYISFRLTDFYNILIISEVRDIDFFTFGKDTTTAFFCLVEKY